MIEYDDFDRPKHMFNNMRCKQQICYHSQHGQSVTEEHLVEDSDIDEGQQVHKHCGRIPVLLNAAVPLNTLDPDPRPHHRAAGIVGQAGLSRLSMLPTNRGRASCFIAGALSRVFNTQIPFLPCLSAARLYVCLFAALSPVCLSRSGGVTARMLFARGAVRHGRPACPSLPISALRRV